MNSIWFSLGGKRTRWDLGLGSEMESAKPSSSPPPYSGGAGAGGKFRKPPISRKRPSTPYDRPSLTTANNESVESRDGGWLSKLLVNPARRLIVDGAARILPSFFSKSEPSSADEYEDDSSGDRDNEEKDAMVNACVDAKQTFELGVSSSSRDADPSNKMDKMKGSSEHTYDQQDKSKNSNGDLGLDQIENFLKGKQFSRDESKRLMEILNSRLVDVSDAEGGKKAASVVSQGLAKADVLDSEIPKGKQYDFETALLETPMPRVQSNIQDEVAASPIDIAKAYMGNRTSELGFSTYRNVSTDGREQQCNDLLPSKPNFLTPSLKSSTCWPGAMVQDQRGYLTPQNQRGRYGLHNFARTPYSRTIYSRTKPKVNQLQADSKPPSNISLSTFSQSQTPNLWQMKTNNDVMDGGYGSVGPIRRVRNKFGSEQSSFSSAKITSSSSVSRSFVPVFQKNQGNAGTSGTLNLHTTDKREQTFEWEANANPTGPSDETVKKILEQLDRHKPTPKEKAAELKLATEWKRSPSQDTNLIPKRSFGEGIDGGVNFKGPIKTSNNPSNSVDDAGVAKVQSSIGFKKTGVANEKSTVTDSKGKEKSQPWSFDNQTNGQDLTKKRPSHPILKPISFNRPDPQQVISHDNGRGFTFPWSAAAASSASEPPTPSIMPSFPAPQSKELPVIPTYSFGTKKSGERVVFSFPSTSSAPIDDGTSDLKFNFGSDKKRVSFGLIARDPIVIN